MRIAVFGATGGTGDQVVRQALDRGHRVVALVRSPEAVRISHERLRVVRGDVLRPATVEPAVVGADAVISALGIGYRRHATTVYSAGTAAIIGAMASNDVKRLVVVSTSSIDPPGPGRPAEWLVARCLLHPLLHRPYTDIARMERCVRASGLDWTIVRAARLTNGRPAGTYRTAVDARLPDCWSISRADLAAYLLDELTGGSSGSTVDIAY